MTVRELIDALSKLPADAQEFEVVTEGCDCVGRAAAIAVERDGHGGLVVMIRRPDGDSGFARGDAVDGYPVIF